MCGKLHLQCKQTLKPFPRWLSYKHEGNTLRGREGDGSTLLRAQSCTFFPSVFHREANSTKQNVVLVYRCKPGPTTGSNQHQKNALLHKNIKRKTHKHKSDRYTSSKTISSSKKTCIYRAPRGKCKSATSIVNKNLRRYKRNKLRLSITCKYTLCQLQ